MSVDPVKEKNQQATIYVGDLDQKVNETLLFELFTQVGPVVHVNIPKDRLNGVHQGYGFVEFKTEEDAEYAIKVMTGVKLYGKQIKVAETSHDKKVLDVGANLFIGNLAPDVTAQILYDTFSRFGTMINSPKIMTDPITGQSKGFGFISYDSFEASDLAISAMNGQYLASKQITVTYAFKRDPNSSGPNAVTITHGNERHGDAAERLLAAQSYRQRQKQQLLYGKDRPEGV
ncbi:putative Splicing factor 3B subunit 4 [Blattamonas nauphoetae]|uniref:Splicing factor 3B subunit 4 n=1 Tax=Blattamonas nauphoetae TaxID=2049346 RepID=A0ABQ9YGJ5_9EUKA|nr:putative Splicing factor 3B subunit 4 [Blattamonas nauphoetae]